MNNIGLCIVNNNDKINNKYYYKNRNDCLPECLKDSMFTGRKKWKESLNSTEREAEYLIWQVINFEGLYAKESCAFLFPSVCISPWTIL